jgi:hypothetical protein
VSQLRIHHAVRLNVLSPVRQVPLDQASLRRRPRAKQEAPELGGQHRGNRDFVRRGSWVSVRLWHDSPGVRRPGCGVSSPPCMGKKSGIEARMEVLCPVRCRDHTRNSLRIHMGADPYPDLLRLALPKNEQDQARRHGLSTDPSLKFSGRFIENTPV